MPKKKESAEEVLASLPGGVAAKGKGKKKEQEQAVALPNPAVGAVGRAIQNSGLRPLPRP